MLVNFDKKILKKLLKYIKLRLYLMKCKADRTMFKTPELLKIHYSTSYSERLCLEVHICSE